MKTVFLVRHGKSTDNGQRIFQGLDSNLSDTGIKQAELIADRLSSVKFDLLVSSDLPRALQTAEIIGKKAGHQVIQNALFREVLRPSSSNGKSWDDKAASRAWEQWDEHFFNPDIRIEDGDNYTSILDRVDASFDFLLQRPEDTIVVVSHGLFIRSLVARVLLANDISPSGMRHFQRVISIENTGITILHYRTAFNEEAVWRLFSLNDHAHFTN